MNLLSRLLGKESRHTVATVDDYFTFLGQNYPLGAGPVAFTQSGETVVPPDQTLSGYANSVYKQNGPVAALSFVRQAVFSTVEFKWQRLDGRELWGSQELRPLEEPWQGGTTQNLLSKTEVDGDFAGNSYWVRGEGELIRWRPDWVDIILGERADGTRRRIGYRYHEGGRNSGGPVIDRLAEEVAHFMPLQDPVNPWRGMSWVTPVIREVMVDQAAATHQRKFFENAATPNLAIKTPAALTPEQFTEWVDKMESAHKGVGNAYKTLYADHGADITPVGVDLAALDLKSVQGGLETRLAAAAGVPPVVVGFREGMQGSSLNAGNYGQARRRFADGTLHPLWMEAAGSFAKLVRVPEGSRLWFDTRQVPFLREDLKDQAEVQAAHSQAIKALTEAGYSPETVVAAIDNNDLSQLVHSGLHSVQLQPPNPDQTNTDPDPDGGSFSS